MLHLNRGELDEALDAEQEAHAIFHTPNTVLRHAASLQALGRNQDAVELILDEQINWPNLEPSHFANVTMPRRCQYTSDPSELLARYTELASVYQRTKDD